MAEIFEGWQCIGICQDERVAVVLAGDFKRLEARNELLESIVRRMVLARPNPNA
jgi:hypothetical protein